MLEKIENGISYINEIISSYHDKLNSVSAKCYESMETNAPIKSIQAMQKEFVSLMSELKADILSGVEKMEHTGDVLDCIKIFAHRCRREIECYIHKMRCDVSIHTKKRRIEKNNAR